jgi:hypothetical protein
MRTRMAGLGNHVLAVGVPANVDEAVTVPWCFDKSRFLYQPHALGNIACRNDFAVFQLATKLDRPKRGDAFVVRNRIAIRSRTLGKDSSSFFDDRTHHGSNNR